MGITLARRLAVDHLAHRLQLAERLPVLPEKAAAGLSQLGIQIEGRHFSDLLNTGLPPGHRLGEGQPLFPKVEA